MEQPRNTTCDGANELLPEAGFVDIVRYDRACIALQQAVVRPRITPDIQGSAQQVGCIELVPVGSPLDPRKRPSTQPVLSPRLIIKVDGIRCSAIATNVEKVIHKLDKEHLALNAMG